MWHVAWGEQPQPQPEPGLLVFFLLSFFSGFVVLWDFDSCVLLLGVQGEERIDALFLLSFFLSLSFSLLCFGVSVFFLFVCFGVTLFALFFSFPLLVRSTIRSQINNTVPFTHGILYPRRCEGFSHLTFLMLLLRVEKSEAFAPDSQIKLLIFFGEQEEQDSWSNEQKSWFIYFYDLIFGR